MNTLPAAAVLSKREKLALLCDMNAEWLEYQAEEFLHSIPGYAATAGLLIVKRLTKGEIGRKNLGKLPIWILGHLIDDQQFDDLHRTVMQWLSDL